VRRRHLDLEENIREAVAVTLDVVFSGGQNRRRDAAR
jgi:hypothetical protein